LLHHELIYHKNQDAEWVVFLHGAGGSIATWKYQLEAFKSAYHLLLVDLRDHGQSRMPDEHDQYTFELISADILAVINKVQISQAHFITLSFGSVILQDLSIRYPQLIKSAIFAGGIFKPNFSIKAFVYLAKGMNNFLPYRWMYSLFSYLLMPRKHHQLSRKIYKKQAEKISPKAYMRWVGLYREFFELLNRYYYQTIGFPSLVIMGKEDYVFLKSAKKFTQIHDSVNLQVLSGAGHICNIDQVSSFNKKALTFIEGFYETGKLLVKR